MRDVRRLHFAGVDEGPTDEERHRDRSRVGREYMLESEEQSFRMPRVLIYWMDRGRGRDVRGAHKWSLRPG